jgi:hypothetical protein
MNVQQPAAPAPTNWFKTALNKVTGSDPAATMTKEGWQAITDAPMPEQPATKAAPNPLQTAPQELIAAANAHINMSSIIKPEQLAVFPEEQRNVLMEMLNNTARMGYLAAHQSSTSAADAALNSRFDAHNKSLPEQFKQLQTQQATAKDPLLSNAALAPAVTHWNSVFTQKFPTANADQIAALTAQYIREVVLDTNQPTKDTATSKPQTNWDELLA